MGYPIAREVKVWAPESLTHREKLTALVLADDANDTTRLTFSSVVAPDILRFAMVKNERDMRKILAKLQDAKVIEQAASGHNGRIAKFRFLHLDPAGCPGASKCACPSAALAVQNEPPTLPLDLRSPGDSTEDVGGPNETAYATPGGEDVCQKEPPTEGVGGSNRHRRRSKTNRPTPSTSSTTSSSTTRKRADAAATKPNKHTVADDLTGRFWEIHGKSQAQSYLAVRSVIRTAIGNGIARDDLAHALDRVAREGLPISGGTLQVALRPTSRPGSNHQPYRTPEDPSIYDSEF